MTDELAAIEKRAERRRERVAHVWSDSYKHDDKDCPEAEADLDRAIAELKSDAIAIRVLGESNLKLKRQRDEARALADQLAAAYRDFNSYELGMRPATICDNLEAALAAYKNRSWK